MKKKILYTLIGLAAMGAFVAVLFCDMGFGMGPLGRFFILFFGLIIGFQCVPAVLMFSGLIRGIMIPDTGKSLDNRGH